MFSEAIKKRLEYYRKYEEKHANNSNTLYEDVVSRINGNAHEIAERLFFIHFKQKSGRNRLGPCPLHKEKHGKSFSMRDDGVWTCFGKCNRSGNMFNLVTELLHESKPLYFLAKYIGIKTTTRP